MADWAGMKAGREGGRVGGRTARREGRKRYGGGSTLSSETKKKFTGQE